jgi:hypothetical protein
VNPLYILTICSDAFKTNNYNGKWMINDGDRHGYKTKSSAGCILYTVIIN